MRVLARLGDSVVRRPWWVILVWVALAVALPSAMPTLKQMAERHPVAILPDDAPSMAASRQMLSAFQQSGTDSFVVVVLTNDGGLDDVDEAVYRKLVDALSRDAGDDVKMQDFLSAPAIRAAMTSEDNKSWLLPITLPGSLGTPQSKAAFARVAQVVDSAVPDGALTAYLTGPAATVADLNHVGERDLKLIEFAITVLVLGILWLIYRNPVTMVIPLVSIAVAVVVAQAAVAGAAQLGLGIANQTIVFMSGMMVGAGTDYAVFLISRYHDHLRLGHASDDAVRMALMSIGKVIVASAATVVVTFLGMSFTRLGLFASVGPALAIAIAVAFLSAVTLLPAVLVVVGRRGWIRPRRDLSTRFWRRSGARIVRRPGAHLIASVIVLVVLAGCVGAASYNYDDRVALPASATSSLGYAALERHFPLNAIIPEYLVISSPRDLRTAEALADLEQMAQRISQLSDIASVRGITRPTGAPLDEAKVSYQAGEIGRQLAQGSQQIDGSAGDLGRLDSGAGELADQLASVSVQVSQVIDRAQGLLATLTTVQNVMSGTTLRAIENTTAFVADLRTLGESIGVSLTSLSSNLDWITPVITVLNASPVCDADPVCALARGQLQHLQTASVDGAFVRLAEVGRRLRDTKEGQNLAEVAAGLHDAINLAAQSMRALGIDDPGAVRSRLDGLQEGAQQLAGAGRQVADGVHQLVDRTTTMAVALQQASTVLLSLKQDAGSPSMSGFYLPPQAFGVADFAQLAKVFISPDGHTARYLIQTGLNPFSTAAMDQVDAVLAVARGAQPNTELADASVSMVGFPVVLRDTRDYYNQDIRFIVLMTIVVVLAILIALLRALVAPVYLMVSVVVSYLAALGLGAVVFQFLLGQQLHWSVPGLTFIILVAVGADYNMLLISRIREEATAGLRLGVIRTVGSTGGVITAAGLIFAATMFGLLFSSITTMVQSGFVVGVGLLLDTFVVRTITIPAAVTLVGKANWWPTKPVVGQRFLPPGKIFRML